MTFLKKEGISAFNKPDGSEFLPDPLPMEQLMKDEFCEIVVPEDEKNKYNHGGPYLPNFVLNALMRHCMVPLEDYEEHNREWLALPGPMKEYSPDVDLWEIFTAFFDKVMKEQEKKRSEAKGSRGAGPSNNQDGAAPENK